MANLSSMDNFCKSKKVFFTDNDRISYSVKKSRCLYNEFRGSMNKSFKYTKNFDDHPDLNLLNKEWKLADNVPSGSRARSLKELSQKKDRNSNIMVICSSPNEMISSIKEYDLKNK